VLSPSIPLTLVVLPALIIAQKSPENIFTEHASVYILAFGMVAAKITNKLVVSTAICLGKTLNQIFKPFVKKYLPQKKKFQNFTLNYMAYLFQAKI